MKTSKKNFSNVDFKSDGAGSFKAVFSMFDVIDHDNDVTEKSAFTKGQEVRIASWGHKWSELPVGKGSIAFNDVEAWVDGQFFLDTEGGSETYKTVKNLGSLQEWSYGFHVLEEVSGVKDGKDVNILKKLDVFEVSPVLLGAGIGTRTEAIKGMLDDAMKCQHEECKQEATLLIHLCKAHGPTDVEPFATILKQALAECDEEAIKALITALTPVVPVAAPGLKLADLIEVAKRNSHSLGGVR